MREETERNARSKASIEQRVAAAKEALIDAGRITQADLDQFASMAEDWRPENGAKVVARAWTDPDFRARLLENATLACAEMGYAGPQGEYIVALENTPDRHNVIVCTQCSCTAWPLLGLPPDWYKSPAYRARVVREPRKVLREMGLWLSDEVPSEFGKLARKHAIWLSRYVQRVRGR